MNKLDRIRFYFKRSPFIILSCFKIPNIPKDLTDAEFLEKWYILGGIDCKDILLP